MEIYLAGCKSELYKILSKMEVYIASNFKDDRAKVLPFIERDETIEVDGVKLLPFTSLNVLESFFYVRDNTTIGKFINTFHNFMLDSGAFTFMTNTKTRVDWDRYVAEYAEYINKYNIKYFFELDIDGVVGLKKVETMRQKLESLTKKKCIPVWHPSRGYDYFIDMVKEYGYVALGGIVSKDIPKRKYELIFPKMIADAHANNCKIHGLGYTSIDGLFRYRFDSVDSTAWLYGNMGGYLYKFNPVSGKMNKISLPKGKRLISRKAVLHNFNEWIKFQNYARKKL